MPRYRVASRALLLTLWAGPASLGSVDGVDLTLVPGLGPGELMLQWTGGAPTFSVYRHTDPKTLLDPGNRLGDTSGTTWTDTPPPAGIEFYEVLGPTSPPAAVTPGVADRLLLSGTIVGPAGFFDGDVLVEGSLITCVAPSCAAASGAVGATVIQTNGIILPGLIDAHNHGLFNIFDETDWSPLQFYGDHNDWTQEQRYQEMIDAKQYLGGESGSPVDYRCEMDKYAEIKALIAGTTSMLVAPGTGRTCYASVIRTIDTAQNDLGQDKIQTSISVPSESTAQSVCANFADGDTNAYVVHVGEGVNQTALNEFTTLSARAGGCLLAPETTIVHGTALGAPELATMAANDMRLVWSPKSNMFLYNDTTRIDLAILAGLQTIALAPDWNLGGSINLLNELRFADQVDATQFGDILTPARLAQMVTLDAARTLGVDALLGSLEVGKRADVTVVGGDASDPYAALLATSPASVRLVLVDGRALYGDVELIGVGPSIPGCETIALCGRTKFLCVAETNTTNKLNQTYAVIRDTIVAALMDYDVSVLGGATPGFSPIAPLVRCP